MTLEDKEIHFANSIERAAENVGSVWPLHSFVTANPLSGFEDQPFHEAVAEAERLFGGRGYPHPSVFRQAWKNGQIDPEVLTTQLESHGFDEDPETLLDQMETTESAAPSETGSSTEEVDRVLSKWLAAFLDQGNAKWPMPDREAGFYAAWREVAPYDGDIPSCDSPSDLPETPIAALEDVLAEYPQGEWEAIFEQQLAALPGWTGFIKQRASDDADPWQSNYPISLTEYLAVRLLLADFLDASIQPDEHATESVENDDVPLPEVWLTAWEESHRDWLLESVSQPDPETTTADEPARPAAQLVFCIDTRSEIIRRHVEAAGPYETHGYAGFFGIPMRYQAYDADVPVDACPPIVDAQHRITDRPTSGADAKHDRYDRWQGVFDAGKKALKALKSNTATAFSFVENAGPGYGAALAARTLLPARIYDALHDTDHAPDEHESCELSVDYNPDAVHSLREGLSLEEKVEYAQTAFELMGWEEFARLVVFTGHASQTTNNPFDSSLDCGACAGNPGGPNARALAAICNDETVKDELRERGFDIPADTVFLAAEHNTTTDEITLFDSEVPESHREDLVQLREDLTQAQSRATAERTESMADETADSVRETQRRAADWAETRPEWGLAGNASFVIGPRELTEDEDLGGRTFLHSYDWRTDSEGEALEAIMTGPLVVTQWINNQYYFATVDNAVYGSGSKVTQNPVGNVGVFQGNGGDLMTGLPLQSLYADADQPHHQPLRLTAVIHAPVEQVTEILRQHDQLLQLLDNGWIQLTVLDPEQDNAPLHYEESLEWEPIQSERSSVELPVQTGSGSAAD
ncbi:DUF2309 domain-containing protein [Halorussus gelatinilyticus]|uniref:Probable inorganic carbon transporter subunit DabA n=1 Tax=Halorussus gelatinilyticus TaxID=2937524 RepID=A0A8U0IHE9_9EURY|nr:DUF2309 domain-containing protein [Halorussus gelatinilyticus]UPW00497.1 DUF2309 domain-containing protein [Halorussus gelatinilyticus]